MNESEKLYRLVWFHHLAFNVVSFLFNSTVLDDNVNLKKYSIEIHFSTFFISFHLLFIKSNSIIWRGFPPNSDKIPSTSASSDWLKLDPHMMYIEALNIEKILPHYVQ